MLLLIWQAMHLDKATLKNSVTYCNGLRFYIDQQTKQQHRQNSKMQPVWTVPYSLKKTDKLDCTMDKILYIYIWFWTNVIILHIMQLTRLKCLVVWQLPFFHLLLFYHPGHCFKINYWSCERYMELHNLTLNCFSLLFLYLSFSS